MFHVKRDGIVMRYKHDCDKCIPLGTHKEFDLYFCHQGADPGEIPTVIARYGDEGEDYQSGWESADLLVSLRIAKMMALDNDLPLPHYYV